MSTTQGLTAARLRDVRAELAQRWPAIGRWLRVHRGEVCFDYIGWTFSVDRHGVRGEELATALEQQIAYYEWLLEQRVSGHLAGHRLGQYVCTKWTDSMTYCCRRMACFARGENPGAWVDQHERRPDLAAEGDALAARRDTNADPRPTSRMDTDPTSDRVLARVS